MKKYKVWAKSVGYCYLEVEAESDVDALDIAENTDGGEFAPVEDGYFEIMHAEEVIE